MRCRPSCSSGKDGFPIYPPVAGKMMTNTQIGDRSRVIAQQDTMQALARNLASQLKTIVTDATGLTAKYDFTLTYASLETAPPPAHMSARLGALGDIFTTLLMQHRLKT